MVKFYCLNYNNPERKERMTKRFEKLELDYEIVNGVSATERASSCMFGHLSMLQKFIDSNERFGIMCEDDIFIHKDIKHKVNELLMLDFDIILLGYLYPNDHMIYKHMIGNLYTYPNDLWGAQMYLITREYAMYCLNNFKPDTTPVFSSDFTITKNGRRYIYYPMLAVEEIGFHEHQGQHQFHKNSHLININNNYL